MNKIWFLIGIALVVGAVPRVAAAQGAGDTVRAGSDNSSTATETFIYRRERFVYPISARRNPFQSLLTLENAGPSFDDLDLVGVIFGGPTGSVATLIDGARNKTYRVRRGDDVGNARVVEIRPEEVVFSVTSFGVTRSETLRIRKNEEEEERG